MKLVAEETSSKLLTFQSMFEKMRDDYNGRLEQLETAIEESHDQIKELHDQIGRDRGFIGQNARNISTHSYKVHNVEARMEALEKTAFQDDTFADRLEKLEAQSRHDEQVLPGREESLRLPHNTNDMESRRGEGEREISRAPRSQTTSIPAAREETPPAAGSTKPSGAAAAARVSKVEHATVEPTAGTTTPLIPAAEYTQLLSSSVAPSTQQFPPADPVAGTTSRTNPSMVVSSVHIDQPSNPEARNLPYTIAPAVHTTPGFQNVASPASTQPLLPPAAAATLPSLLAIPIPAADDAEATEPSSPSPLAPAKKVRSRGHIPTVVTTLGTGPRTRSRASTPQPTSSTAISATSSAILKSQAANPSGGEPSQISAALESITEETSGAGDMDLEVSDA